MGLQLIFCVESNKQKQTDYIYIKETVEHFYDYDRANVRLNKVCMNGKGNYDSIKTIKEIQSKINMYSSTSPDNKSVVIYCFDCDDYDIKPEDREFLYSAKTYCEVNNYEFAWFCKEIESVYLGDRLSNNMKVNAANRFMINGSIKLLSKEKFSSDHYKDKYSNLCNVLDKYI